MKNYKELKLEKWNKIKYIIDYMADYVNNVIKDIENDKFDSFVGENEALDYLKVDTRDIKNMVKEMEEN